jgi:antitoxin ParD1/3/4
MTVTLEIPPEIETQLRERASYGDAATMERLIAQVATPVVEKMLAETPDSLSDEEFEALSNELIEEFARCVGPNHPVLSDYAVSREGIYEEHP